MDDKRPDCKGESDPSDSTQAFDAIAFTENNPRRGHRPNELFETYEPRSLRTIIEQQRAERDSEAAQAARVILDGVEPPDFDPDDPRVQRSIESPGDASMGDSSMRLYGRGRYRSIRVQRISPMARLATPGAQFIYALVIIMLLSGLIGLAASTKSPELILTAGVATPMLLPICIWKWIRWLDSDPYYYRLLTSLGEDARNLLQYRLFWKRSDPRVE